VKSAQNDEKSANNRQIVGKKSGVKLTKITVKTAIQSFFEKADRLFFFNALLRILRICLLF